MPYIEKNDRAFLDNYIHCLPLRNKGELEYVVFKIMKEYMKSREYRYSDLHDVVYAVQHCSDEFRRRFLDKREDEAREKNGDIE